MNVKDRGKTHGADFFCPLLLIRKIFILLSLVGFVLIGWSCSSDVIEPTENDPLIASDLNYSLYFRVNGGVFSRAGSAEFSPDDDAIESLSLAFFKRGAQGSSMLDRIVDARKIENSDGLFKVEYLMSDIDRLPDYVVAIANLPEVKVSPVDMKISLARDQGILPMATVRYFDNDLRPVYYTNLSPANFIADETETPENPVQIYLERCVAKVTLKKADRFDIDEIDLWHQGKRIVPKLSITGWGVTATDAQTYLLKNIDNLSYSDMTMELGDGWKWNHDGRNVSSDDWFHGEVESNFPILHWSHSVNYDAEIFPPVTLGKESDGIDASLEVNYADLLFPAFASLGNNQFSTPDFQYPLYVCETTRRSSVFGRHNALPLIVLSGQYSFPDYREKSALTFYRKGRDILFEDEFESEAEKWISEILGDSGSETKTCVIVRPSDMVLEAGGYIPEDLGAGFVAPQVIEGTPQENIRLLQVCGLWEKYHEGNCVFTLPVRHLGNEPDKTGYYGIVRNHHYDVTLTSVSGIGRGVTDLEMPVGDMGSSPDDADYLVRVILSVAPWNEVDGGNVELVEETYNKDKDE